jgi:hypothetical protein
VANNVLRSTACGPKKRLEDWAGGAVDPAHIPSDHQTLREVVAKRVR